MYNNQVIIQGRIKSELTLDHDCFGEKFYKTIVSISRDSGVMDDVPVIVSERLFNVAQNVTGNNVFVCGEYRSYNQKDCDKKHLILFVFASEFCLVDDTIQINEVYLEGHICSTPSYRTTPLGRQISDMIIAVNRPYGKSDYIPCVSWGRNACYSSTFEVGQELCVVGRIQSREYKKNEENKIAYEVSVNKLELIA